MRLHILRLQVLTESAHSEFIIFKLASHIFTRLVSNFTFLRPDQTRQQWNRQQTVLTRPGRACPSTRSDPSSFQKYARTQPWCSWERQAVAKPPRYRSISSRTILIWRAWSHVRSPGGWRQSAWPSAWQRRCHRSWERLSVSRDLI